MLALVCAFLPGRSFELNQSLVQALNLGIRDYEVIEKLGNLMKESGHHSLSEQCFKACETSKINYGIDRNSSTTKR